MSEDQNNQNKTITLDQLNQILKKKDIAYASHYTILSLNKEVPFTDINTSQQKRLVKSAIDSPVFNTEFIYTIREILKENCQDPTVNIDELTLVDKLVLLLALRIKSIGSSVKIEVDSKDGKKIKTELDLNKILELVLKNVTIPTESVFEDEYFKITCSVPTIGIEYKADKELRGGVNTEIENLNELRETVGNAFISEIVKYIKNVLVVNEESYMELNWNALSFKDRIRVLETFKSPLLKNIIDYINTIQNQVDKVELINFEINEEKFEKRLSLDSSFFTIS